ncbi:hypothetical protein C453_12886 [Haloferax elongans ATCC BAA-1513]|uniref:Uncharacterized protein n=1 Tax=Haloferax elongans ATCC BAA-1513 TaxID=1230453 RepID=M0HL46_HALEO|nr:hypothetical protein [Haloferax elongans]ELZ84442.1 hypothetical protein C453_12886 [Haloferax elongans ATCC BAA-1513]
MRGTCKFDPSSGAALGETQYLPDGTTGREVVSDPWGVHWTAAREGALTHGEHRSSTTALTSYFRRVQREVRGGDEDASLTRAASLAIRRVKAAATDELDTFVWLAVAERLAEKGHWTAWMLNHYVPRCPHCHSEAKFRAGVQMHEAVCASSPDRHGAVDAAIEARVRSLLETAFDDVAFDEDDPSDLALF